MNAINKSNLKRIIREYNPEYDVPPGPRIPWYTAILVEVIQDQQKEIDELKTRLNKLADATG